MPELTQNENGKWKLKGIHHDIPGVTIQAHYTYPYYHGQTVNFEITSQQGEDVDTPWETELGTPIISTVTADEIKKKYDECIIGNTRYVVKDHEFQVVPYNVVFEITNNTPVVESIVTSERFAVRSEGVSDIGYDESESVNVTSVDYQTYYVDVEFGENLEEENRTIKITLSGKTASGKVIKASASITQKGYDPEPTIWMNPDKWVVPYVGTEEERTAHVYITVRNGRFSGYTLSDQNIATAHLEEISDSEAILTLVFNAAVGTVGNRTLHVTGCGINGSKTDCVEIEIEQTKNWSLSDVDYVIFTYEWGEDDGKDLDSFTFIDGLATGGSSSDWCHEYFEKGVGFGNGKANGLERYVGDSYQNSILKFSGDNRKNGREHTVIDFKKLNEIIENGIETGKLSPDGEIVIYLSGCWYTSRNSGNTIASFSAYKGGYYEWELIDREQEKYAYVPRGEYTEVGSKTTESINIFSKHSNAVQNYMSAIETYTTVAAFVYDYSNKTFYLEYDSEEIKNLPGNRYRYGLQSRFGDGKIAVSGSTSQDITISDSIVFKKNVESIQDERVYNFDFSNVELITYTGSTQDTPVHTSLKFDSCSTVSSSSTKYDGDIRLELVNDHSFRVTVPAGHKYSGSYDYGYEVYYHILQSNYYLKLMSSRLLINAPDGCFELCVNEETE